MPSALKNVVRNCKEATLLSLKKEQGQITMRQRLRLFVHLLFCDACQQFVKQSAIINRAMNQLYKHLYKHPTHQLRDDLKQKMQQQLDNHNRP